jgi:hypothetical protein
MQIDVGDILAIGALMVFVSVVLLGYIDPRRRQDLPSDVQYRVDHILVIGSIMVLLSLLLFWW